MAPKTIRATSHENSLPEPDERSRRFLHAFPYYIRVDFSCKHFNEEQPHRFVEHLTATLADLCDDLARNFTGSSIVFMPAPFTFSPVESQSSQQGEQDRGTLIAGLELPSDEHDEAREAYYLEAMTEAMSQWHANVLDSDVYADEQVAPTLFAILTRREFIDESLRIDCSYRPGLICPIPLHYPEQTSDARSITRPATSLGTSQTELTKTRFDRLRPAVEILNGLKHDIRWIEEDYEIIFKERFGGFKSIPASSWAKDSTDESFVPQHRISAFRNVRTGQTVWHKDTRLDLLYGN